MRLVILFDLPMETKSEQRNYRQFRQFLISEGFIMMQKSVYVKLCLNNTTLNLLKKRVRKHIPPSGIVQMFNITEKQYANIEYLSGYEQIETINSQERIIFL